MTWIIKKSKKTEIYWVGYYKQDGSFYKHDRHKGQLDAERHCSFLNGGVENELKDGFEKEVETGVSK